MSKRVLTRRIPKIPTPELDFTSESFDPAKALAAKSSVYLPFPKAKTYNNLAEYYSHTFLKKDDRESTRIAKEETRERNYAWYYSTMGHDPSYGNEYYAEMYKNQNKVKRRKGKKPANTTTTVCENMRANKIVKLKSKYKLYCRRKFNKWKRETEATPSEIAATTSEIATTTSDITATTSDITATASDVLATETPDIWTSTTNYAKEFINPSAASVSLDDFLVRLIEGKDLETLCPKLPAETSHPSLAHLRNGKVLLKLEEDTDELSFLSCILFGKVESASQQSSENDPSLPEPSTGQIICQQEKQTLELIPSQDVPTNAEPSNLLCIDLNSVRSDNSAYETESSGYMSDCSEISIGPSRSRVASKNRNLMQAIMKSNQAKNTNKPKRHAEVSKDKPVLISKENNIYCETQSKESSDERFQNEDKSNQNLINVASNSKNSKSLNGCVCDIKSTEESACQCVCGFYKKAINEIRKFKIPRKKSAQNVPDKKKRKRV